MDIHAEIELERKRLQEQQRMAEQKKNMATLEAEMCIPEIVKKLKDVAIYRIASNSGTIYSRGLLGKVKYIKIQYKLSQDDNGEDLKRYLKLRRANNSIYPKLISAINAAGFCNTKVSYYEPRHYYYITTEFNLPK